MKNTTSGGRIVFCIVISPSFAIVEHCSFLF